MARKGAPPPGRRAPTILGVGIAVACLWIAATEEVDTVDPAEEVDTVDPAEAAEAARTKRAAFAEPSYWKAVYGAEPKLSSGPLMRSWQGVGFEELRSLLEPVLRAGAAQAQALVLGCGDSALPEELVDAGAAKVTGVDFSAEIVASMEARTKETHSQITWLAVDAAEDLGVPAGTFDVAVDVGLLDVMVLGKDETRAQKMLAQAHKALRPNGTYVSVSMEAPKFRQPLFDAHPVGGWSTAVVNLPRSRDLDPRILQLDPSYTVGNLSVYVSRAVDAEADQRRAEELERAARVAADRAAAGQAAAEQAAAEQVAAERGAAEQAAAEQAAAEREASAQAATEEATMEQVAAEHGGGQAIADDAAEHAPEGTQPANSSGASLPSAAEPDNEDKQQGDVLEAGDAVCSADSPDSCNQ